MGDVHSVGVKPNTGPQYTAAARKGTRRGYYGDINSRKKKLGGWNIQSLWFGDGYDFTGSRNGERCGLASAPSKGMGAGAKDAQRGVSTDDGCLGEDM